jgi:hypothetical protein
VQCGWPGFALTAILSIGTVAGIVFCCAHGRAKINSRSGNTRRVDEALLCAVGLLIVFRNDGAWLLGSKSVIGSGFSPGGGRKYGAGQDVALKDSMADVVLYFYPDDTPGCVRKHAVSATRG